ncbi:PAP2 family protein [Mycolicibacterium moriokaense]|nr:PAP2 family protein [Mycolicibacterium moriokaense]
MLDVDDEPLGCEAPADRLGEADLVFDHKYAHVSHPSVCPSTAERPCSPRRVLSVRSAGDRDPGSVGEMTSTIGSRIVDMTVANSPAVGSVLVLTVCAAAYAAGWAFRDRMPRWWSMAVRVGALLMSLATVIWQVCHDGWLVNVDDAVTAWLVGHRIPIVDQLALAVTNIFGPVETACVAIVVAVAAVIRFRSGLSGVVVIATAGGAAALCEAIKFLVARDRPPTAMQLTLETDYSMPSGHVTGTVALFGMVVVVVGVRRSAAVRTWLAICAVTIVAAVAFSRVYLGVHWFTDVLAGMLLGAAMVDIGATTLNAVLRQRLAPSPRPAVGSPTRNGERVGIDHHGDARVQRLFRCALAP